MHEPSIPVPSRTAPRRWRVPAHFLYGAERFDGASILEESPGPLGLLLWQSERDVRLWAMSAPAQREELFSRGAAHRTTAALRTAGGRPPELRAPMAALASMLEHPMDIAADAVMLACERIAEWAEGRGATSTALTFAQAAALTQPGSAPCAYRVGRLARRGGQPGRAEGWLNRAIVLARQARDWDTYAAAYSGLGNVNLSRGNLPAAERCQCKALRIATRHEIPARAGAALHDLFVVAAEAEQADRALQLAEIAFRTYPAAHQGRVALAHDVALLWMEQGHFACAMPVLRAAWSRLEPDQQVVGLANVARAAGALGDRGSYEEYGRLARAEMAGRGSRELRSVSLLNLARGAASLGDLQGAAELAAQASASAAEQKQNKLCFEAEALLQALGGEMSAAEQTRSPAPESESFASEIESALAGRELASGAA